MFKVFRWALKVTFCPPRVAYKPDKTVCAITDQSGNIFVGSPVSFPNRVGYKLQGTLWRDSKNRNPKHCLIFLHSLGTNQFECLNLIPYMVTEDLAMFSFDFTGCGISEGPIIPLDGTGIDDSLAAVDYLSMNLGIQEFAIWGRSMGAAIALQTCSHSRKFSCIVSDSAFSSIDNVIKDQARLNGFPRVFVGLIKPLARIEAERSLGTNLSCTSPYTDIPFSSTPLLMGHGKDDSFVPVSQALLLFDNYGGTDKQLYIFEGKHNTARPSNWFETASRFVFKKLGLKRPQRDYYSVQEKSILHSGPLKTVHGDLLGTKAEEFVLENVTLPIVEP